MHVYMQNAPTYTYNVYMSQPNTSPCDMAHVRATVENTIPDFKRFFTNMTSECARGNSRND